MADAVADSARTGAPVEGCLHAAAREAGQRIGAEARAVEGADADSASLVMTALAHHGYEPEPGRPGEIVLANCPFHRLAEEHRDLVCGMNLDLLDGVLDGAATSDLTARLDPAPGQCCVRITST